MFLQFIFMTTEEIPVTLHFHSPAAENQPIIVDCPASRWDVTSRPHGLRMNRRTVATSQSTSQVKITLKNKRDYLPLWLSFHLEPHRILPVFGLPNERFIDTVEVSKTRQPAHEAPLQERFSLISILILFNWLLSLSRSPLFSSSYKIKNTL